MRKLSFLLIAISMAYGATAQLSEGGQPLSFKFFKEWDAVPAYKMPTIDVAKLLAEDAVPDPEMKKPIRFGYASFVTVTPQDAGVWHTLDNDHKVWMLRIKSTGAFSLSLGFRNVQLPPEARLFIYNKDHSNLLGAFTARQSYVDQILATEQINGDEVMIEYETSSQSGSVLPFELYRVSHDYKDINKILKSFGDAGACQVNINCPAGNNYQDVKKGVAAIISNGVNLCSGTLVTTTNNSGVPYFLTANHCFDNQPASWVFRFNWESPTCTNPATSPSFQSISGASLRAKNGATDFCLVELSTAPPTSYNIIYAGWDKSGAVAATQVCISHPAIDIKKISVASSAATATIYNTIDCWKTGTWTTGCTEPGSSGGPLFNERKRVIGQLFGGPSSCGATTANMYDCFGRFSSSWNGGGTAATRLKDWLDPGNLNLDTTNLYDPNAPVIIPADAAMLAIVAPTGTSCNTTYIPRVVIKNSGSAALTAAGIIYKLDNQAAVTQSWTGNLAPLQTDTITLAAFSTTATAHVFKVFTDQPNGQVDINNLNDTLATTFTTINNAPQALPFSESFESTTFPPAGWSMINPNTTGPKWLRVITAAATGIASAFKNNYNVNDSGEVDHLITPFLDFSQNGRYELTFKVAHARYDADHRDSLKIAVSNDCGATWIDVYLKGGATLASAPDNINSFIPTAAQWREDTVWLNAFSGSAPLQIRFSTVSAFGNNIYLDDINLKYTQTAPATSFDVRTACANEDIAVVNSTLGATSYNWAAPGATSSTAHVQNPVIVYTTPGVYTITLTASNAVGSQSYTQSIVVHAKPIPAINRAGVDLNTGTFVAYQWYRNGVAIPGATSQQYTPDVNGTYKVEVTSVDGCKGFSDSAVLTDVSVPGVIIPDNVVALYPNPADNFIEIEEHLPGTGSVDVLLSDMIGQKVMQAAFAGKRFKMDISQVPSGIYMVRIHKGNVVVNKKVTVQ